MKTFRLFSLFLVVVVLYPLQNHAQGSVTLNPTKDNTIYNNLGQAHTDSLSNGAGSYLVAGNVNTINFNRRALIKFDLSSLATTVTVDSVVLKIHAQQNAQHDTGSRFFTLHKLKANWGEGTSDAGSAPGTGAAATTGDATWKWTFYTTSLWSTYGGYFESTASATTDTLTGDLLNVDVYWRSTLSGNSQMKTDVQNWVKYGTTNNGWLIKGVEGTLRTATMFYSRESSYQPVLTVYYH